MPRRTNVITARHVGPLAAHLEHPLLAIDVGCRDGEAASWIPFEPAVRFVGFEPDAEECHRLQRELEGPAERTFVPVALGARSGEAVLHVTRQPQSSSLYEPDPDAIARHPQLAVHEEVGRRSIAVTTLDAWTETDSGRPDALKLDVQGAELDVLRGAERALKSVRALQVEVEFQPLYRGQPLFQEIDAHLRERGFVLWRLRGMRHLAIAGAEPAGAHMGASFLPDEVERAPSGGRLSWADAIYIRADLGRPPAGAGWRDRLRDACVAAALDLPELARVSLAAAREGAPEAIGEEIEQALRGLSDEGCGRPEEVNEIARLRAENAVQSEAATARAAVIEELTANRDWAYREIEQLRERVRHLESGGDIPGRTARLRRPLIEARRRTRQWTAPRLGVLRHHAPVPIRIPRRQARLRPPQTAPSISVVVPTLNQGRFVERTIRSVLDQEYPALELVVQDGGSTDGTLAVLDAYRTRLSGCASEPDAGQGDAINRGFARTSGEIMAWLNSDDVLLPGALAAVSRHFARHPETDVVYGHRIVIDESDRQVGCWILPRHENWALDFADLVPQETLFWRRSTWEAAGGRIDTSYDYALDWDLLLRFVDAGARIVRLPLPLGGFRLHEAQKTTAQIGVGLREIERIRAARHGQPISHSDAWGELSPYLRRHVARHTLYRLAARVPGLHVRVAP